MSNINITIKLKTNLPINESHGCTKGKIFNAKYQNTKIDLNGIEHPKNTRDTPVEFTGAKGELCVAFSNEYEIVRD